MSLRSRLSVPAPRRVAGVVAAAGAALFLGISALAPATPAEASAWHFNAVSYWPGRAIEVPGRPRVPIPGGALKLYIDGKKSVRAEWNSVSSGYLCYTHVQTTFYTGKGVASHAYHNDSEGEQGCMWKHTDFAQLPPKLLPGEVCSVLWMRPQGTAAQVKVSKVCAEIKG